MAVRLALRAGRVLPPGRFVVHISVRGWVDQPQGHSAAGRIRSIEKKIHLIGTRIRDLPTCSIVPQPTTLPRALNKVATFFYWTDTDLNDIRQKLMPGLLEIH
jgi:hypothetical protein